MNQASLTARELKALLSLAPKDEQCVVLNGIGFDFDARMAVVTNGHYLLAMQLSNCEGSGVTAVPRSLLELAAKAKPRSTVSVDVDDQKRITVFWLDGKIEGVAAEEFVPWQNVIPSQISGETRQFDPEYLHMIDKALRAIGEVHRDVAEIPLLAHNGESAAFVIRHDVKNAFALCMPCNTTLRPGDALPFVQDLLNPAEPDNGDDLL